MLDRTVVGFALLLVSAIPARAATIILDDACGGTPQVGSTFSFVVPTPVSGTSNVCLTPTVPFVTLHVFFSAPPSASDTTCSSSIFVTCSISQTGGITDVSFRGGPGLQAGVDFHIALQGFTTGQTINGVANVPEPATFFTALPVVLLAINALRRARRQPTPGMPEPGEGR
jgi:hypothetical protein